MINRTVILCLSASGIIALAIFVVTLHTGGRVTGLHFLELLAIACGVQVVGFQLMVWYYIAQAKAELTYPAYISKSNTYQLVAALIALIGLSACGGGGLLIFR